jgi:hypothetical protein
MKMLRFLLLLIPGVLMAQGAPPSVLTGGSTGTNGSASFLGYISLMAMPDANYTLHPNEWWPGTIVIPSSVTLTAVRSITPPANAGQKFVLGNYSTGGFAVTVNGISVPNGSQVEFDYVNGAYVALGGGGGCTSGCTFTSSSINGVTPSTSAGPTTYLNGAGAYTTPAGSGGGFPGTPATLIGNASTQSPMFELSAVPKPALQTWMQALHNCSFQVCNVVILEDSTSRWDQNNHGTGAALGYRWPDLLYKALAGRYGSHGTGIVPIVVQSQPTPALADADYWVMSGTYDTSVSALAPSSATPTGNNSLVHLHTGAVATFHSALGITWDTFHLYYATSSSSGSCVLQADGSTSLGSPNASNGSASGAVNAGYTARRFDATALTNTTHTVTVTASGDCYLYGAEGTAGTTGVSVHNIAIGAAAADSFGTAPANQLAFSDLIPTGTQALFWLGGSNEVGNSNINPSQATTLISAVFAHETALSSTQPPSILYAFSPVNNANPAASWVPYVSAFVGMCGSQTISCVNIQDRWGLTWSAASGYWASDGAHPSTNGAEDLFSMMFQASVDQIAAQSPPYISPFPLGTLNVDQNFNINPANVVPSNSFAPGLNFYGQLEFSDGTAFGNAGGAYYMFNYINSTVTGWSYCLYPGGTTLSSPSVFTACHTLLAPTSNDNIATTGSPNNFVAQQVMQGGVTFGANTCGYSGGTACDLVTFDTGTIKAGIGTGGSNQNEYVYTTNPAGSIVLGLQNYAKTSISPWLTANSTGVNMNTGLMVEGSQTLTGVQGSTGTKIAAATGTFTSGNCRQTDANGNEVDSGAACGGSGFTNPMTTLGDTIYGASAGAPTRLAGPTTTGTYFLGAQPTGSSIAPAWVNLASYLNTNNYISGPLGESGYFVCVGATVNSVVQSLGPCQGPVNNPITSATGGSGTGTVACATASCTNLRGSYTVAGGTFATGTLLTLVWPTTSTAYVCSGSVLNNATGASIGYHSVATATGMTFSSLTAATGLSIDIDYSCQP